MPAKKAAAKASAHAKSAAKKSAAASPKKAPARPKATTAVQRPAKKAAAPKETTAVSAPTKPKKAAKPQTPNPATANRTRVVIAMEVYEPQKDGIKAPFKEYGLKWNFLGEGKGLYKHPEGGIHCFTQFKDDGVHYSLWGADDKGVQAILAEWRRLLGPESWAKATASGEEAQKQEEEAKESEALRAWKLAQPQPRPGEPDFFFKKRVAEWEAKRPA